MEIALEEVLDQLEFLCRIAGSVFEGGGGKAGVKPSEALKGFGAGTHEDFAPVAGIAKALDEAGFFEAVEDAGDGASGKTGGAREVAGGKGPIGITRHQFKASGISNIEAHSSGDSLMEENGSGAQLAAELHADTDDQGIAPRRRGGFAELFQLDAAHFILTANYLTD